MFMAPCDTPRSFKWLYGRQSVCTSQDTTCLRGCLEATAKVCCRILRSLLRESGFIHPQRRVHAPVNGSSLLLKGHSAPEIRHGQRRGSSLPLHKSFEGLGGASQAAGHMLRTNKAAFPQQQHSAVSGKRLRWRTIKQTPVKGTAVVKALDGSNFESEISGSSLPVVVEVWGSW